MKKKKKTIMKTIYKVAGCIQGYGMDSDKFYNVVYSYPDAASEEEALALAEQDKVWYGKVYTEIIEIIQE